MNRDIRHFETQLLGWAKSTSKKGPIITLQLQCDDDIEYFELLTIAKGKTAGQLLDIAVSLSKQDSQSQEGIPARKEAPKPKGGSLCRDAALLCKNPMFWEWMASEGATYPSNEAGAKEFILAVCLIESRSHLDHNVEAAKIFKDIHREYSKWLGHS